MLYPFTDILREYRIANGVIVVALLIAAFTPFAIAVEDTKPNILPFYFMAPACFVQEHTGKTCATCGLTRSVVSLYHGDWAVSRRYHPHGYLVIAFILLELLLRIVPLCSRAIWVPWLDIGQFIVIGILTASSL